MPKESQSSLLNHSELRVEEQVNQSKAIIALGFSFSMAVIEISSFFGYFQGYSITADRTVRITGIILSLLFYYGNQKSYFTGKKADFILLGLMISFFLSWVWVCRT